MNTLDRINRLCNQVGVPGNLSHVPADGLTKVLDRLDIGLRADTWGGQRPNPLKTNGYLPLNYVGARLALLEDRAGLERATPARASDYSFWLGNEVAEVG